MGLFGLLASMFSLGVFAVGGAQENARKNDAKLNALTNNHRYYYANGKQYSVATGRQVYIKRTENGIYEVDVKTAKERDITSIEVSEYNRKSKKYSELKGYPVYRCHPLTFTWMGTINGHQMADLETGLPCDIDFLREPLYAVYTYNNTDNKKEPLSVVKANKDFINKWHEFINDKTYLEW